MSSSTSKFAVIFQNVVLGIAILIFAKGFFPHKAVLPGLAAWPEDYGTRPAAPFNKVIFMVVDALRSDFVYSNTSQFHFTQELIRDGAAVPFTGRASPPTITMPRVKSITTGSVPSFLDLVLNFAESDTSATLAAQDSWLAQIKAKDDGKLTMFGDDTWLRLFPSFFERSDGTTSFFVSDFTEVDQNVTRHLSDELKRDDWSGMIMHYLGMDHIGHKTGPRGPEMPGKQREMDGIVRKIYTAMETEAHLRSSLLVLLGDHGMNEGGNHGANSAGEVSTALTFLSPKFKDYFQGRECPLPAQEDFQFYDTIDQTDIAPTLAALIGFPIPKNSLGVIIPSFLSMWREKKDRYSLLYRNAEQLQQVARATYPEAFDLGQILCMDNDKLTDKQRLACKWFSIKEMHSTLVADQHLFIRDGTPLISCFLKDVQRDLSGTASKYDTSSMFLGILLAALCCIPRHSLYSPQANGSRFATYAFFFVEATYSATMFASSYIEEEHQFWYWISGAWLVILLMMQQRCATSEPAQLIRNTGVCLLFGLTRRLNQTGQKYSGAPDIVKEVFAKAPWLLWLLVFLTYAVVQRNLRNRLLMLGFEHVGLLVVLVAASALVFKLAFTMAEAPELMRGLELLDPVLSFAKRYPLQDLARVVFLGLGNLLALSVYTETPWRSREHFLAFLERMHEILTLFLMTQTRTVNIPLFLLFHLQLRSLQRCRSLRPIEAIFTMVMLQYSSFFAFGGTNAISSVDLSNAYNGIASYNVLMVGVLTFVSNWAGPIWWASATCCVLTKSIVSDQVKRSWGELFGIMSHFNAVHATTMMLACFLLREHLFVWTVFSPKYLYTMAWTYAQHMMVNGIFSAIISASG